MGVAADLVVRTTAGDLAVRTLAGVVAGDLVVRTLVGVVAGDLAVHTLVGVAAGDLAVRKTAGDLAVGKVVPGVLRRTLSTNPVAPRTRRNSLQSSDCGSLPMRKFLAAESRSSGLADVGHTLLPTDLPP